MKKQIIFIHGGDSYSRRDDFLNYLRTTKIHDPLSDKVVRWPDTLRAELGEEYEVYMPAMPNKYNARYDEWSIWFERYFDLVEDGVILIGWSLGGMFLAKYLSEAPLSKKVNAVYLLASPSGKYFDQGTTSADCADFRPQEDLVGKLGAVVSQLKIWHSEDDFVVPISELKWYQTHIPEADITIFKDKNHFLVEKLPEIIASIKQIKA